jgi:hypothetical protein
MAARASLHASDWKGLSRRGAIELYRTHADIVAMDSGQRPTSRIRLTWHPTCFGDAPEEI